MGKRFLLEFFLLNILIGGGCWGGVSNQAFLGKGEIHGRFEGTIDVNQAWVALEGSLEKRPIIDADGRFLISDIAVGEHVLLAADGVGRAKRLEIMVLNQSAAEIIIAMDPGAWIEGVVRSQDPSQGLQAELGVENLDVQVVAQSDGHYRIQGLPQSCYWVWARYQDYQPGRERVCVTPGQGKLLYFSLQKQQGTDAGALDQSVSLPDHAVEDQGGYLDREDDFDAGVAADVGYDSDANIFVDASRDGPSLDAEHIEDSNWLDQGQADGHSDAINALLCQICNDDQDCGDTMCSRPLDSQDGQRVCSLPCEQDDTCPAGFTCQETDEHEHLCLPRGLTCVALLNLGANCDSSNPCGLTWEPELCQDGLCTMPCDADSLCPSGFSCQILEAEVQGFCY